MRLFRAALAVLLTIGSLTVPVLFAGQATAATCNPVPFRSNMARATGPFYRVPSLARTGGVLVAFAERRPDKHVDEGNFDIVESRSTNGGCTWSAPRTLVDASTYRASNPLPLVDPATGQIVLMFTIKTDKNYLYTMRSADKGVHWTARKRLQTAADGITNWHGGMVAPGNGLVLTSGPHKGRMLFPIGAYDGHHYRIDVAHSDDHGRTWTVSASVTTTDYRHVIEASLAQTAANTVVLTAHEYMNKVSVQPRWRAVSTNDGTSFGTNKFVKMARPRTVAIYNGTFSPIGTYHGLLLMAGPSWVMSDVTQRRDPAVWVSRNNGATWSAPLKLTAHGGFGSYTAMVQMSNTAIGLLYETGKQDWKEQIRFVRVSLPKLAAL